ncbi:MAG: hypothetical protein KC619_35985 [Myxococcales bacterium]|nr:hypothetical protein [Myxococcales bacterium]
MRRLLLIALLGAMPASAAAQDEDAGAVTVEVHTERPPEGSLRRGVVPAPSWALYAGGGLLVAAAAGALGWRLYTRSKRR